jgi:phage baseplate assembly protein W
MTISRVDRLTPNVINQTKPKKYSDFTTNFEIHPDTGDLFLYTDANAVKKALRNLVLTNFYERRFKEKVGSNIRNKLFEQLTANVLQEIASDLRNVITNFEKRVVLENLQVNQSGEDAIIVNIVFSIANIPGSQNLSITVNRVR